MSSRYGRKKRAAHRAEIAGLKQRISRESTAHMYLPGKGVPELTEYARVLDYRVTEEGAPGHLVECGAYVTVEAPCDGLLTMMHEGTVIQFMGRQYIVAHGNYSPAIYHGGEERVEIELRGVS